MTLLEAHKTGKKYRLRGSGDYYLRYDLSFPLEYTSIKSILFGDWEVESETVTVTQEELSVTLNQVCHRACCGRILTNDIFQTLQRLSKERE